MFVLKKIGNLLSPHRVDVCATTTISLARVTIRQSIPGHTAHAANVNSQRASTEFCPASSGAGAPLGEFGVGGGSSSTVAGDLRLTNVI